MVDILYDGIIFSLQRSGGISVLFDEITGRLPLGKFKLDRLDSPGQFRRFERFRDYQVTEGYRIFHSTYYRVPSVLTGAVVATVHDYTYERFFGFAKKQLHSWQKNRCIGSADKIICVSESTKRDLMEFSGSKFEDRVVIVPNGVSEDYYPLANLVARPQVLFVGARGGYKNFIPLVQALSMIKDVDLVCVGGGEFTAEEVRLLDKLLAKRYWHKGYLTNAELNEEYNKSICLAYPSLYEGFGIPVLEAMRASCPVLAVNKSSIPEVAGDAALLMEKGDADEIVYGVEFFLCQQNRRNFASRGLVRARQFSWDRTYIETLAVYEEIIGSKLGGGI
ncbi:glycosyltransferase family 4 protein [Stutzerimonas stutzeri]|uniref:glycosyltransferase family 4 protein n=1 Tax=Stutzerimonas stutzeri TaxID=316 RepID=UPI002552911C|nr:glycosyltransferase family 1 protein [Stutzerimonas stutzeri]